MWRVQSMSIAWRSLHIRSWISDFREENKYPMKKLNRDMITMNKKLKIIMLRGQMNIVVIPKSFLFTILTIRFSQDNTASLLSYYCLKDSRDPLIWMVKTLSPTISLLSFFLLNPTEMPMLKFFRLLLTSTNL